MKRSIFIALATLLGLNLEAQVANAPLGYYNDAILFSQTSMGMGSTARVQGIGGAQVSLGGDMSIIASNPAGLGFFNKSVFSFTPALNFNESSSQYLGNTTSSFANGFNFANIGGVFYYGNGDYVNSKFKRGSLGVSINRTNNFKNDINYQGVNGQNSIIDSYINSAGLTNPDNLGGYAFGAFENYLIDPLVNDNGTFIGYGSPVLGNPRQIEIIETSGSQYQINLAYGANYNDFIYFGAGLGIATVNYSRRRTFTEDSYVYTDNQGNQVVDDFINFTELADELNIEGAGVNANFGLIVRPIPFVTLGVSYITPTYYALSDDSGFNQFTSWNGVEFINGGDTTIINDREFLSDISTSDYSLRTPGRLNLGATFFLGKIGFITGDVEFVDYTSSQLKSSDFEVFADNQEINSLYTSVMNYRTGIEFRIKEIRLRGGYAYHADPFENSAIDLSRRDVSFGVGYRNQEFFVDMTVVNRSNQTLYSPYFLDNGTQPVAEIDNNSNAVAVTLGFNF
ncbi:MAG: hypothetical protein RIC03_17640 [Cyclobacteriaceae bacterium]